MEEPQLPADPQPVKEDENVIADYYDGVRQLEMQGHETSIRKARNTLFFAAALVFIGEMISIAQVPGGMTALPIAIALIEAGVFVALAFWTRTRPYSAIIAGIVILILYWALAVYVETENLYKGVLVRIVIIVFLARAAKDAKAWEQLKKQG